MVHDPETEKNISLEINYGNKRGEGGKQAGYLADFITLLFQFYLGNKGK